MPKTVRELHKRSQATGYDWEQPLAVEMCRAGVGRVSGRPLLVIPVVFGVMDCRVLKRSYFDDFGRVFDESAAVLSLMSSQSAG